MRALGLMSGTSLDGVDAAVLETDGETIAGFGPTRLPALCAGRAGGCCAPPSATGRATPAVERGRGAGRGGPCRGAGRLRRASTLVGFHGQTLAHEPQRAGHAPGRPRRPGSRATPGVPVVWDFRTADVACGRRGRAAGAVLPLRLRPADRRRRRRSPSSTSAASATSPGSIRGAAAPEAPGALLAFDTGPANALIDDFLRRAPRAGLRRGRRGGGRRARSTRRCVARFAAHPYFVRPPPKSLDREDFHGFLDRVAHALDRRCARRRWRR